MCRYACCILRVKGLGIPLDLDLGSLRRPEPGPSPTQHHVCLPLLRFYFRYGTSLFGCKAPFSPFPIPPLEALTKLKSVEAYPPIYNGMSLSAPCHAEGWRPRPCSAPTSFGGCLPFVVASSHTLAASNGSIGSETSSLQGTMSPGPSRRPASSSDSRSCKADCNSLFSPGVRHGCAPLWQQLSF
jgi:hypothetical protein